MEFLIVVGLIWLIGTMLGKKTPQTPAPPRPPVDPALIAERLANQKRDDDQFKQAFGQWIDHLSESVCSATWAGPL
jgi:DNA helicase IV